MIIRYSIPGSLRSRMPCSISHRRRLQFVQKIANGQDRSGLAHPPRLTDPQWVESREGALKRSRCRWMRVNVVVRTMTLQVREFNPS
jgi:hypothetical protein